MFKVSVIYLIYHVLGRHRHDKSEFSSAPNNATTCNKAYDTEGALPTIEYSSISGNEKSQIFGKERTSSLPYSTT